MGRLCNFFKSLFRNNNDVYLKKVKIVNKSKHRLPEYETCGAAGMDVKADLDEPMKIEPHSSVIVPTGLYISLPKGYECQIRGRSGLAFKYDIYAHLGTIDEDYRGEIKVKLYNLSDNSFLIHPGERICQMVISPYERIEWEEVRELDDTKRGEGGFGSTGIK